MKRRKRPAARGRLKLLAALALTACSWPALAAESYPTKIIRLVVPFAPGGTTDLVARAAADLMSKDLGQPIVVENKAGASAVIGSTAVARAEGDGYTLLFTSDSSVVLNPLLYAKLPYSVERDLAPVGVLVETPMALTVDAALPVKDVSGFIRYAKAEAGKVNYGSTGYGGAYHLAAEQFVQQAGVEMTHIPYKGGSPAAQALLGGEVQAMFNIVGTAIPFAKSGKFRILAVSTKKRLAVLPEVPTFAEAGLPDFDASARYGLAVPRSTPPAIVERLARAVNKVLATPKFRTQFENLAFEVPEKTSPAEYKAMIEADSKRWGTLIQKKNIRLELN